jgi:hypothetical protein
MVAPWFADVSVNMGVGGAYLVAGQCIVDFALEAMVGSCRERSSFSVKTQRSVAAAITSESQTQTAFAYENIYH